MPSRRNRGKKKGGSMPATMCEKKEQEFVEQDSIASRTRRRRQKRIAAQVSEAAVEAAEAAFAARSRADYAREVAADAEDAAAAAEAAADMAAGLLEKAISEEEKEEEGEEEEAAAACSDNEGHNDSDWQEWEDEDAEYESYESECEEPGQSCDRPINRPSRRLSCASFSSSDSSLFGVDSTSSTDEEDTWSQIEDDYSFFMPRRGLDKRVGKYDVVRNLQWGGFGSVFHVMHHKTRKNYAMKVYRFGTEEHIERELMLLMSIRHVNVMVVSKLRSFVSDVNDARYSYVIMPLYPKDLSEYINFGDDDPPPSDADIKSIMLQICGGLGAVHAMNYVHADLKPENILVDDSQNRLHVCLCDFGSVFDLSTGGPYDPYGHTLALSSPELVCNTAELIDAGVDIFPLACIYTELCKEQTLFYEREDECIYLAMVAQVNMEDEFPQQVKSDRNFFTRRGTLLGNAASKTAGAMQRSFDEFAFDSAQMSLIRGCCRLHPKDRWSLLQVVDWVKSYYAEEQTVRDTSRPDAEEVEQDEEVESGTEPQLENEIGEAPGPETATEEQTKSEEHKEQE